MISRRKPKPPPTIMPSTTPRQSSEKVMEMGNFTRGQKLSRDFYLCDGLEAAGKLLGKILVNDSPEGLTAGRIVELEAYMGENDRGCHAYGGRRTTRTEIMYAEGGHAYVYLIYGMYCCMNIIVNRENIPHCIFLRALEPVEGIELMKRRRGTDNLRQLCSGPGRLCIAMGIDKSLYGEDLCGECLWLEDDGFVPPGIIRGRRVNIDYAGEDAERDWRFAVRGSHYISSKI